MGQDDARWNSALVMDEHFALCIHKKDSVEVTECLKFGVSLLP